jgi:2-polyprenyl-3-methyl-5-hydroxy-6-metoxy-1,4-benzoquinol methylase
MDDLKGLLQQQIAYYRARASEYDEWFLRQGRYDRGPEWNRGWFREVEQVRDALEIFKPEGKILELACGTGLWTQQLVKQAESITAVDAVGEVLQLNEQRLRSAKVNYLQADIFNWQPQEAYDLIFFSFWLSHVPEPLFEAFWKTVKQGLAPGGRVFFVDSRFEPSSTASDHQLDEIQTGVVKRRLNNGQEYEIVKIFHEPEELEKKLRQAGWRVVVKSTLNYFLYGSGRAE